ncbi:MAG: hypothetical protein K2L84_09520, partial [Muribaculaceae bacterium]|nr:hypothetical protein [Muribaculaceae bacterium]
PENKPAKAENTDKAVPAEEHVANPALLPAHVENAEPEEKPQAEEHAAVVDVPENVTPDEMTDDTEATATPAAKRRRRRRRSKPKNKVNTSTEE